MSYYDELYKRWNAERKQRESASATEVKVEKTSKAQKRSVKRKV